MISIETIGLTKYFFSKREKISAIKNINFNVKESEIFGIIGPNEAGKTTLLKILSTLILPTKGTAFVNGYEIIKEPIKVKSSIGLITGDERSFYWRLSGKQNLEFFAAFYNIPEGLSKKTIENLLSLLQINNPDQRLGEYSAGMKQRLGIARSLLHNPPVLLMDEPTKSLDPGAASEIRTFIKQNLAEKQKKAIILATHNMYEAEQICDRIGLISKGEMFSYGTLEELRKKAGLPKKSNLEQIYEKNISLY